MLISSRNKDPAAVWFSERNKRPGFVFEIMNGYPVRSRRPPKTAPKKPPQQDRRATWIARKCTGHLVFGRRGAGNGDARWSLGTREMEPYAVNNFLAAGREPSGASAKMRKPEGSRPAD
ncbi:hypothetical protein Enr13x_38870 [Stieleria neptunia]|uniref:Uncharacterized protein n=1 Tax=Stieleria neptunia TaxID=2527979 RepID=A0A518HT61_9BACT|nr:hypothetical protein Enr13x_38870 [Stieleria neptunia]